MEAIEFVHVSPIQHRLHEMKLKPIERAWEKPTATRDRVFPGINQAEIASEPDEKAAE